MGSTNDLGATKRILSQDHWTHLIELPALFIAVVEGPDSGKDWILTHDSIRIGLSKDNDIVLKDETVSRYHAKLLRTPKGILLKDLGSTNGTFVRGVRTLESYLDPGSEFRLGHTSMKVETRRETFYAGVAEGDQYGPFVGESRAMREVYGLVEAVSRSCATVLVGGESGTGKELVAKAIHEKSQRGGPLVVFDASSTSPDLIRSELFGHEEGAFTGAQKSRKGAFRSAHRGTLFIDEIGELPLALQPNLLRVIETREIKAVGADHPTPVDVRLVAATNRDLEELVRSGGFREDLYHRLSVIHLRMPPLRERREDIPLLVRHFVQALALSCRFTDEALEFMKNCDWPGNVRALRNLVERMGVLREGMEVRVQDLDSLRKPQAAPLDEKQDNVTLEKILATLKEMGGNKAKTARALGIGLTTLKRKLKET